MTRITLADLDPTGHTSFSFYDFLPGRGFEVTDAPSAVEATNRICRLLAGDLLSATDNDLDQLAALLLTHGGALAPGDDFDELADATARAFAALIGNDAMRPRRMRLTRLSLMLRVILDRAEDTSAVKREAVLPCKSPWDWVGDGDGLDGWAVTCDEDNLRRLKEGEVSWSVRCGLPTQLDPLGDGLWVGSHYSAGGDIVAGLQDAQPCVTHIAHDVPLVLAFDFGPGRFALDARGALWQLDATHIGERRLQLPAKVHRARVIGSTLYAFDWAQAGTALQVDLPSMRVSTVKTGDIIVCNDLCGVGDVLYGICKLQGRVFKLDRDWKPLATRLGAGVGPGQLMDPIMIRARDGRLSVLNWFSAKLVEVEAF